MANRTNRNTAASQQRTLGQRPAVLIEPLERRTLLDGLSVAQWQPLPPETLLLTSIDPGPIRITGPIIAQPAPMPDYGWGESASVEHNKPFTVRLGSFHSSRPGNPAAYVANLDWGDGSVALGSIERNHAGDFAVLGSHTFPWGAHAVKVTITRPDASDWRVEFTSTINSVPPAFAGSGKLATATACRNFSGVVASYVGLDTRYLDRYVPEISWGDGSWGSDATLQVVGEGVVNVIGRHRFLKPGLFDTRITLRQAASAIEPTVPPTTPPGLVLVGGGTDNLVAFSNAWYVPSYPAIPAIECHGRITVDPGPVDGTLLPVEAVEGVPYQAPIARFTTTSSADEFSHYRAVVNGAGLSSVLAPMVLEGSNAFRVEFPSAFSSGGGISVYIYDDRLPEDDQLIGAAAGFVSLKPHLAFTANSFSAVAGVESTAKLGEVTSLGTGTWWSSSFTATVSWGDGSSSDGQVVANDHGGFDVLATHTYKITGYHQSYTVSVRIDEQRVALDPSLPAPQPVYSVSGYAYVNVEPGRFDGFTLQPSAAWIYVSDQTTVYMGTVTVGDPSLPASAFRGTVIWADGVVSPLSIFAICDDLIVLQVTRGFTKPESYAGQLQVSGGGISKSVSISVSVHELPPPPLGNVSTRPIYATEAVEFTGTLGYFWPSDPAIAAGEYSVRIYWADGSSPGTLVRQADGSFAVVGTHTYADVSRDGCSFSFNVTHDTRQLYGSDRVHVQLDPSRIHAQSLYLYYRQREQFTAKVAHFTPPQVQPSASADQFTASIDWGDGTTSGGIITTDHQGGFDISGTSRYPSSGSFTLKVTICGPGGPVYVSSFIWLSPDPVLVKPVEPQFDALRVSGLLAQFFDEDAPVPNPSFFHSNYAALIDWGDGQITAGDIAIAESGTYYNVGSEHVYTAPGEYVIQLIVRRNGRGEYDPHVTYARACSNSTDAVASAGQFTKILYKVRIGEHSGLVAPIPASEPFPIPSSRPGDDSAIRVLPPPATDPLIPPAIARPRKPAAAAQPLFLRPVPIAAATAQPSLRAKRASKAKGHHVAKPKATRIDGPSASKGSARALTEVLRKLRRTPDILTFHHGLATRGR